MKDFLLICRIWFSIFFLGGSLLRFIIVVEVYKKSDLLLLIRLYWPQRIEERNRILTVFLCKRGQAAAKGFGHL